MPATTVIRCWTFNKTANHPLFDSEVIPPVQAGDALPPPA
jgi:hypothetical protein